MSDTNRSKWENRWGIDKRDAMRLSRELVELTHAPGLLGLELINRCREIISRGLESYRLSHDSVSLEQAVAISLEERSERRARTLAEIRRICRKLLDATPQAAGKNLREFSPSLCKSMLEKCFHTRLQFHKARAVLHAIFACGMRHGWCSSNPVAAIPRPILRESEVLPLSWPQLTRLMRTARRRQHIACLPAVGMMLWAGIRPAEILRLQWEDIDWQEKVINLKPRHSKTGGSRHITLHPALAACLKQLHDVRSRTGSICPPNWLRRWRALRLAAGLIPWRPDVLRHTFASYHLKRWHDLNRLQIEMGHRSARLLQTRYLSMKGITHHHALLFWSPGML